MSLTNELHTCEIAMLSPTQERSEQTALLAKAGRLQELFVALWEARRRGEEFVCSLHPDRHDHQHPS
jgi:hypothetical protein